MPRMLAAATAAAAAPLTAAFTSHLGNGAYAAPAPVLQLAAAVGLSVLCAHALVLTLVWGGMLLELRGEVRILLQRTIDAPDVALSKTVHATLRRESGIQLFTAIIGAILVALSLLGHSHMPASSGSDPRSDLPRYGSSHAYHQSLHHHALAKAHEDQCHRRVQYPPSSRASTASRFTWRIRDMQCPHEIGSCASFVAHCTLPLLMAHRLQRGGGID